MILDDLDKARRKLSLAETSDLNPEPEESVSQQSLSSKKSRKPK